MTAVATAAPGRVAAAARGLWDHPRLGWMVRSAVLYVLLVEVLVGGHGVVNRHVEPPVVGELEVGSHVDLGGEGQLLAVLELGDVDLRRAQPELPTRSTPTR